MINRTYFTQIKKSILISINKKRDYYAVHEPIVPNTVNTHLNKVIKSNDISSTGSYIIKFEEQLKKITKSRYVILTNSGTSALEMVFRKLDVKDCEVLMPTMSFVATSNSVLYNNGIPHFIDSMPDNPCIDVEKLEEYLTINFVVKNDHCYNKKTNRKVKALLAVHAFGFCANLTKLKTLCKEYKLELVEDAAGAIGSFYGNKHAGTSSNFGIISFNGNKLVTTGVGGAILLKSKKDFDSISHDISTSRIKHSYEIAHDKVGYNYRMANINASIGYTQLLSLDSTLKRKKSLHDRYKENFEKIDHCKIIGCQKKETPNYWINNIIFDVQSLDAREKLFNYLHNENIFCRALWTPLHTLKMNTKYPKMNLANALSLWRRTVSLPSSYI